MKTPLKPPLFVLFLSLMLAACEGKTEVPAPPDPQALIRSAEELQAKGAFQEAEAKLQQALAADPGNLPAQIRLGSVYAEWDRRDESIAAYKKALELAPENIEARLGLADMYSRQVRNELAIEEYKKVAAARPDDPEIHFKLALEHWYLQKLPETVEYYQKVIALRPGHLQAHLNLASVYERMKEWGPSLAEIGIALKLAKEQKDEQAVAIAAGKLAFIEGRKDLTAKELKRKSMPPFE